VAAAENVDVEIRWADVDAYGHVSHIALVAIAEHGRSRWLDSILEIAPATWPYIVARLELDYRAPITFDDRVVRCRFEPQRIGTSSVQLRERFTGPDGVVVMEAQSVIVAWDEAASGKRALSEREVGLLRARMPPQ
jgi:acyl-CoA thioester hydrolase